MPSDPVWLNCIYTVSRLVDADAKRFHLGIGIGQAASVAGGTICLTDQAEAQLVALQALSSNRVGLCLIRSDSDEEIIQVLKYGFGRVADGHAVLVLCSSRTVGNAVWAQIHVETVH